MHIEQRDLDALTDELLMEAFAQNNEGVSAKIYRNIHYKKFSDEAKARLKNSALDKKIEYNKQWEQRHSFNITEFEMDMREVLMKHQVSYMAFGKGYADISLANSSGGMTLDMSISPNRENPADYGPGWSDAWVANVYVSD